MQETANYYKIGRRLAFKYPELAEQLLNDKPIQREITDRLPEIYNQFTSLHTTHTGSVNMARLEFVAIIVKHADPEVLTMNKKLKSGVRADLAKLFTCDGSQISHILKNVKDYLSVYKEFRNRVEYLYSEIFKSEKS